MKMVEARPSDAENILNLQKIASLSEAERHDDNEKLIAKTHCIVQFIDVSLRGFKTVEEEAKFTNNRVKH